jgi:Tfp pilus assembly protein PilP
MEVSLEKDDGKKVERPTQIEEFLRNLEKTTKIEESPIAKYADDLLNSDVEEEDEVKAETVEAEETNPDKEKEPVESDFLSTYEERKRQTPTDKNTERGHWEDKRGESRYIPTDEKIKEILAKYGLDGIEYKDAIPDFSKCSESTVEIDNMSENRYSKDGKVGNFEQADQKCAEQWNKDGKDGKTDWTARDVANWRRENGYSWHECNDRKTCQLIPTEINDYFGHLGGIGECTKANAQEEGFDE